MLSSGILRFSLAKRSCLKDLQPIRIRTANTFAALAFLVWPTRRRILQRAVCHLAGHIDNNTYLFLYCKKQINSMLPCICSLIDHRRGQNVVRTLVTHLPKRSIVSPFYSYHILQSSVLYYLTDAQLHQIFLLRIFRHNRQICSA